MDEEFRLASVSRLDRLEDLVESLRGPLTEPIYPDEEAMLDACTARAITGLAELERQAHTLLEEILTTYKVRTSYHD